METKKDDLIHNLTLTDLIEIETLQQIQDAFSKLSGVSSIVIDAEGNFVTRASNFCEFCDNYTRSSPTGMIRCNHCNIRSMEMALEKGAPVTYLCHAGLVNFAVPIIVHEKLVGCFISGQVFYTPPDLQKIRQLAEEIGVEPESYIKAAEKITILEKSQVDRAAECLYTIANVFSNIAYNRYSLLQYNEEIEKAANMKSDFLANMSHEIRTPMNAVIGMAELALREELPPTARNYINQIISSGHSLLTIINDILDFSKIESGKMDINIVEYEPMSLINDLTNIIMTRIKGRDVELILDITPDIPNKLMGDNLRIRQILLNIVNNAVKFTKKGQVLIQVDYTKKSEEEIDLHIAVEDTGIGIKKEDLGKLFQSFQQLDSKRNRYVEGTGLGLAITRQLLTLMNGSIEVESTYGKGSRFTFTLPQKIVEEHPAITIKENSPIHVAGLIANPYLKEQVATDVIRLNADYIQLQSAEELPSITEKNITFLFIEYVLFSLEVEDFVRNHPQISTVLIINFNTVVEYNIPNLMIVKKPLYILNISSIFNHEDLLSDYEESSNQNFDFVAPTADVLIVDDNAVNLTVAEGLLEPLKMHIDTATGCKEAIHKISLHKYDLIFMDHMMPEIDGVETTHIIRRFHEEYKDVPIIALTANAVEGTKEMFLKEGMNDFVAKPIEVRMIVSKVKQWLPSEKIERIHKMPVTKKISAQESSLIIEDLDTASALQLLGSESLFWKVLKDYYRVIEKKIEQIKALEEAEDWKNYTTEVHALKSASRQIGAIQLSEKAAAMEKAGNDEDAELIHKNTDAMLEQYAHYLEILKPYFFEKKVDTTEKPLISSNQLLDFFSDMREALDNLDNDSMEEIIEKMTQFHYTEKQSELFDKLRNAVDDIDIDTCEDILNEWESKL